MRKTDRNPVTGKLLFSHGQYVRHKAEGSVWKVTSCWLAPLSGEETYHVEEMDRIYPRHEKFEREALVPVARSVAYVEVGD